MSDEIVDLKQKVDSFKKLFKDQEQDQVWMTDTTNIKNIIQKDLQTELSQLKEELEKER